VEVLLIIMLQYSIINVPRSVLKPSCVIGTLSRRELAAIALFPTPIVSKTISYKRACSMPG